MLLNLMRNSIDAIRECRMKHGRIVVTTRYCGDRVQVSVRDSGLGVGLRISRNLIEADGGRL
ncbi:MAG: hypothetical protein B7Y50_00810 [Hydrogenophilales bacterium 28-61-11]|nr:MAG: hypothetical protein B7Y50_00810 [Hydrogenophilales bacterium 28-61-11]